MANEGAIRILAKTYDENRRRLEDFAFFMVRDREAAKDIVSDSFETLCKKDDIKVETIIPYILTVIKNSCLNYRRDESRRAAIRDEIREKEGRMAEIYSSAIESTDPKALFCNDMMAILSEELSRLTEEERKIYMLTQENKTYKEISEILGIPYKRVWRISTSINNRLQKALSDYLAMILPLLIAKFIH